MASVQDEQLRERFVGSPLRNTSPEARRVEAILRAGRGVYPGPYGAVGVPAGAPTVGSDTRDGSVDVHHGGRAGDGEQDVELGHMPPVHAAESSIGLTVIDAAAATHAQDLSNDVESSRISSWRGGMD